MQNVRGDTAKFSDELQLQPAPSIAAKPEKLPLDEWLEQLAFNKFDGNGSPRENWPADARKTRNKPTELQAIYSVSGDKRTRQERLPAAAILLPRPEFVIVLGPVKDSSSMRSSRVPGRVRWDENYEALRKSRPDSVLLICARLSLANRPTLSRIDSQPKSSSIEQFAAARNMTSVLVVEDAAIDQRFAGMLVQREGCEVVYADNGKKAIERIENSRPDIVLTDLQMPEMDGLQLVSHLSSDYPGLPVILMTAHGSEEIAVKALRAGAASYVPKRNLSRDLGPVLRSMLSIVEASQQRDQVRRFMKESHSEYELGNDPGGIPILIGHIQDTLGQLNFGDELALLRISTALTEALTNAIDHGNLELDSALREADDDEYRRLRERRIADPIYRDRRIRIAVSITPDEAAFVIRDDGPGFDPCTLPDPTDPDNLNRSSGRGILLMRTFFDEVRFSSRGNEITLIGRRVQ